MKTKPAVTYLLFAICSIRSTDAQPSSQNSLSLCPAPSGLFVTSITNNSATVNWLPVSRQANYTVQYKLRSVLKWTKAAKATYATSVNITGLAAATLYDWRVRNNCSDGRSTYTQSSFKTSLYCTSSGITSYEYINQVVLGSINKKSGNNNGYADFTGLSTSLAAGTSNIITLTPGFTGLSYKEGWTVFIDYNQNGILNDSGEIVLKTSYISSLTRSFIVPATAKNGSTRLRIVMQYSTYRNNPCDSFTQGEVEDYTVNISGGAGVSALSAITPDNAITTNKGASMFIAPNPAAGSNARIVYTLMGNGKTELQIISADGRTIRSLQLGQQSAGLHNYTLTELSGLSSGTYILQLYQDGHALIRKSFIVVR